MSLIVHKRTVGYNDLKDDIQTGDIVLMRGQYVSSHAIQYLEHSTWSHAAIAIRAEDFGFETKAKVLLWESNMLSKVPDVINNEPKDGPQLVSLHQRMKVNFENKEDSKFAIRHLYCERTPAMIEGIKTAIDKYHKSKFPSTKEEFEFPLVGRLFNAQTKSDTIFCSELVAATYLEMGLLTSFHPTNGYIPADFSESNSVGLLKRAWLGNEIIIETKSL